MAVSEAASTCSKSASGSTPARRSRTHIDRVAGLYITSSGGTPGATLMTSAGRDANLVASIIQSQGSATLQAGMGYLSTLAARNDVNWQRSSQTVKAAITAALTAGVLDQLGATSTMKELSAKTGFSEKLTYNLINASGRALTNTAINGGSLEDALKQALIGGLVDTAHGQAASQIKGLESDYLAHKLAHALAGCVAGAAAGGACRDGAIGGAVGEIVAEMFENQRPGMFASAAEKQAFDGKVLGYSKLVSGAVSAYAGGNAQTAITTAETAVANNFLTNNKNNARASQWGSFKQELDSCKTTAGCDVNTVYSRWTAISNDQQKQAMGSMDALFAANPSDASTAGQWFGKAVSSMYMQATDVCSATDARCISFVQSQQSQAMTVYRTGLTLAYANDMVDGGGRLRNNLLDAPNGVSKTLGAKGEVIPGTGTKVVAQYGPLNAGPLSSDFSTTFRSGTYAEVLTQQPMVLYRVYGGTANQMGAYWTTKVPSGPVQSIIDSALNPLWGNSAINVVKIEVPAGVKFYQGAAASQGGLVGGGDQVLFPPGFKIDSSWKR